MTRKSDGLMVNAVYGVSNMILKLLNDVHAQYCAMVLDASRETFRNQIYADYKANRDAPPPDLTPQFPLVRQPLFDRRGDEL